MAGFNELKKKVIEWGKDKGIITFENGIFKKE
jgi:hypothetical protein